jgi:Na+/proline symporter
MFLHVFLPLLPCFFEGLIRLAVFEGEISLQTFRASTLAMSIGLLSMFVNQSLRSSQLQLSDDAELESLARTAAFFLMAAIVSFGLFALIALLNPLVHERGFKGLATILNVFQLTVFVGWLVPAITAIVTQRSFKLRASIR